MSNQIQEIIKNNSDPDLIKEAFELAKIAYKDKKRVSGENYIEHALRTAKILSEMNLDSKTISAALLHDIVDETPSSLKQIELNEIEKKLGKEVVFLVKKVSEISELDKIRYPLLIKSKERPRFTKEKIENLRKMFFALSQDLRVVLIQLASRLDNLDTLNYLPKEHQRLYALETLKIFVPVAERLGIGKIKSKLEDLSFFYLYPEKFEWLKTNIKEKYEEREKYLEFFIPLLKSTLKTEEIRLLEVNYRAKSYWSTYQKLLEKNMDFEKIYDLVALRIIVDSVENCYKTLGALHKHWEPLSEEIEDYIVKLKPNGYRSLHTAVFCEKGQITEIQIRTPEMHKEAEYGICAHWAYKEKVDLEREKKKFEWVNPVRGQWDSVKTQRKQTSNGVKEIPEFWKTFKIDFFENRVFVFTPKGDVIDLPKESTPIDFAYAVHSDIGNHCEFAKVDGKVAPLSQPLKNGDVVEIIVNKQKNPSPDWLKFVKTKLARSSIKKGVKKTDSALKFFLSPIKKLSFFKKRALKIEKPIEEKKIKKILLAGEKGISVNIAKCCSPSPGDEVKAYIKKIKGASLHKVSCKNFQKLAKKFPEKVIEASWK